MSRYTLFKLNKTVVLAVPSNPKNLKKISYKYYQATTTKRKIVKTWIKMITNFNLGENFKYESKTPVPMFSNFDFESWIRVVEEKLNEKNLFPIVSFPTQLNRNRFYVSLLNDKGYIKGFSKVSLDSRNDKFLENESTTLSKLANDDFSFNIPKILVEGRFNKHKFLIFEPIPLHSAKGGHKKNIAIKKLINDISKEQQRFITLSELSWWRSFIEESDLLDFKNFFSDFSNYKENKIRVCFSHGDLHVGNISLVDNQLWLFDWEASNKDAPYLTDYLAFFLGGMQKKMKKSPLFVAKELREKFLIIDKYDEINVGLALAFLCFNGREDARVMIKLWEKIKL